MYALSRGSAIWGAGDSTLVWRWFFFPPRRRPLKTVIRRPRGGARGTHRSPSRWFSIPAWPRASSSLAAALLALARTRVGARAVSTTAVGARGACARGLVGRTASVGRLASAARLAGTAGAAAAGLVLALAGHGDWFGGRALVSRGASLCVCLGVWWCDVESGFFLLFTTQTPSRR